MCNRSPEESSTMSGILAAVSQREFLTEGQIKSFVKRSNESKRQALYEPTTDARPGAPPDNLRAMLIFITDKQQTWLVADSRTAYHVLDDRRREEPRIWRARLVDALPVQATEIKDENWSARAGDLYFGNNPRKWIYSKNLFAHEHVQEVVTRFLSDSDG
jgi:hypothetical protein